MPLDWPEPDEVAQAHSLALIERLQARMAAAPLSFGDYMEACLYAPGLGYYSAGARKFGAAGDFVTAPELTPLFGRALGASCASVLNALGGGDILELGAGSGMLAVDLLGTLAQQDALPAHYLILERSADLQARQQQLIRDRIPHLAERVSWLTALPEAPLRGLLIANEVLDALPVERFRVAGQGFEQAFVVSDSDGFHMQWQPADRELDALLQSRIAALQLPAGYQSEICPMLEPWLMALADKLAAGAMLFVDYGYGRHEYYHPGRAQGTLMCHYRHRAHPDALVLPGLQDITAYVDFTAVAEAAVQSGLAVKGFTTQAHYLLDIGLDELMGELPDEPGPEYYAQTQALKQLMLPGEMGEKFKAILLTRGMDKPVPGFRGQDFRSRL